MDSKIPTNADYASARELLNGDGPFILTAHVNPDGDAIGSVLGLYHYLTERGKQVSVVLPSACPKNLQWMPGAGRDWKLPEATGSYWENVGVVVVLDLNSLDRLGEIGTAIKASTATILNIDHHVKPDDFAHVQLIDTNAPATCAMLFDLLGPKFSKDAATCLFVGLMTDTGSFRFPRTSAAVMHMAAELIACGADPVECYEKVYNTNSIERTQLLGAALSNMQLFHNGRLCVMTVSHEDIHRYKAMVDDTDGFVQHTLSIEGVDMGVLLVEIPGTIKCSFRSKGDVYIRDLAASYGGGGHNYAAGARMQGIAIAEAVKRIVMAAEALLG